MAEYNAKNYTEQGGGVTHIGGELVIDSGGELKFGSAEMKPATAVAKAAGSAPTKAEFNALITALQTAGLMELEAN